MSDATARLLWASARPDFAPDAVRAAVADGADLERAAAIALSQHVGPLLHRALVAVGVTAPDALGREAARCRAQSRMVLPLIGERVLAPLASAGVEAIVIKGAALASRYPDPALRPMDDVDLVAPPGQFGAALRVLTTQGWLRAGAGRAKHEATLTHPAVPGLAVDLHDEWATWISRSNRLDTRTLWEARRPTELFGAPAYVLPPEEELVMLAAHAAKPFHNFDRLIWIVDLAVVAAAADIDWDAVGRFADATRCRVAVAVGLIQAERLGLDAPASLKVIAASRERALAPLLDEAWPTMPRVPRLRDRVRYGVLDDAESAARVAVGEAFGWGVREMPRRSLRVVKRASQRAWERRQPHNA